MSIESLAAQKAELRQLARTRRKAQVNREPLSQRILGAVMSLPEFALADTVMFYLNAASEVQTRFALPTVFELGKSVVVPWCNDEGELELFRLTSTNELTPGRYGILEPAVELRHQPQHAISIADLQLILVPGVAFDYSGGRIGQGKGYYDKLLSRVSPDTTFIAPAFECQMFETVPTSEHDIRMHTVVTEAGVYSVPPA